jgi:P-type conjugative transfer protein TrbG
MILRARILAAAFALAALAAGWDACSAPPLAATSPGPTAKLKSTVGPAVAPVPKTLPRLAAHRPRPRAAAAGPLATTGRANAEARDWPSPAAYVNATLVYDYEPGRIYTIQTSPRFLTAIALRPGETLISKASGDTVRWVMGETHAGAGAAEQVMIFVKPIRPDLRTNLILTTDQRVYLVDARSNPGAAYTSMISWNYAQEDARALRVQKLAADAGRVAAGVGLDRLDFGYRIETAKGRAPRWIPVRVFDDGAKTFIAFPSDLATSEAPPLFLLGAGGQAELVNYRVQGAYYVVDRLIERAELRLGENPQSVVRIRHLGSRP